MKRFYILAYIVLITGLAGCARPQLLGSWFNPDEAVTPISSVMVVNVSKDPKTRQLYEDQIVEKLIELGLIKAVSSYTVVRANPDTYPDRQQLQEAVKSSGVEGVLTSMVLWMHQDRTVKPGFVQPKPIGEGGWRGWSGFYERAFYEPSMARISNTVIVESYLYDVRRDTLLWSGKAAVATDSMNEARGLAGMTESLAKNLLAKRLLKVMTN